MTSRKKGYSVYPNKFSYTVNNWARHWWGSLLLVLAVLVLYIFFSTLCGVSYGMLNGTIAIEIMVIVASSSLLYPKWGKISTEKWLDEDNIKQPFRKKRWRLLLLVLFVFIYLFWISQVAGADLINLGDKTFNSNMKQVMTNPWLYMLAGCVLAPVSEELMYRGVIYSLLKKSFPVLFSAILQALIFALMHGTMVQFPVAFGLGLFNAMIVQMTGTYLYNIGFHMLFNVGAQFLTPHLPNVLPDLTLALAFYTLAIVLILAIFVVYLKKQELDVGAIKKK